MIIFITALLAGNIPIVPHSTLDPMFEDLPVWLIDNWNEVTDDSVKQVEYEMLQKSLQYNWDKLYYMGWQNEIMKNMNVK